MALPGASDTLSIKYDNWIIFSFLDMDRRSFSSYYSLPPPFPSFELTGKICSIIRWVNELQSQMASGDFIHAAIHLFRNEKKRGKKKREREALVLWGYYQRQQIRHCNAALHSGFDLFPKPLWLGIYYCWVWNFFKWNVQMHNESDWMQGTVAIASYIFTLPSVTMVCCCREMLENHSLLLRWYYFGCN